MRYLVVLVVAALATQAFADPFIASTDRTSYTGSMTKYGTLADALAGTNSLGSYAIPNRNTAPPYDTPYRDLAIFVTKDAPASLVGADYVNTNVVVTAWDYTTDATHGAYSGYGNPNNTNTGFAQLYDLDGNTDTKSSGAFGGWNGTYFTTFDLALKGVNAIYDAADSSNDYARLWHGAVGGAGSLTKGTFLTYELIATFGGLEGTQTGKDIVAIDHPDSVVGSFRGIFLNNNTTDTQYNGYYVFDFTLGMDNWAYGQGSALNGAFRDSYFLQTVPAPGVPLLIGIGLAMVGWLKRRIA